MRWYGLIGALFVVLLAASPALAKMHDTSPPTFLSFLKIAAWIAIFFWFFRRYMGADSGPALLLSIAGVSVALVAGIYIEALVKTVLGIPPEKNLLVAGQVICLSCVNLAFLTAVTAMGAPRLFNQSFGGLSFGKRVGFWVIAVLPALYNVFYPRV
jgi:hypothetical protein